MKRIAIINSAVALLSLQMASAQTDPPIYREVFGNNTTTNLPITTSGWSGVWGGNAADWSTGNGGVTPWNNFGISSSGGNPQNLDNINAGGPALSLTKGYLFTSGTSAAGTNWLAYQNSYTVNTALTPISQISFYAGSTADSLNVIPGFRVAVEIDGNWYATSQVFANTTSVSSGANFGTGSQQQIFLWTTAASAWDSLTFVPGASGTLALGGVLSSPLPGDNITAFGLYSDSPVNGGVPTRRVDTFEIDSSVPEPGSIAFALLGIGMLAGLRRSR